MVICVSLLAAIPDRAAAYSETKELPQTEVGEARAEILSRIRCDLLDALKRRESGRMDSLLTAGDAEFGERIWLSSEERIGLYLLLGKGDAIRQDSRLRDAMWGDGGDYSSGYPPTFCLRSRHSAFSELRLLGYAPDLIDHLAMRLAADQDSVLAGLKAYPDLVHFYSLVLCPDSDEKRWSRTDPWKDSLENYLTKYPDSPFSRDIRLRRRKSHWTGNGWIAGGGPAYTWYDDATASLISDGMQGSFFTDFNFRYLKTGLEIQTREFTARRSFRLGDSLLPSGAKGFLTRFIVHTGYSVRLFPDAFVTPYTGFLVTRLDISDADKERLDADAGEKRSYGFPIGAHFDYLVRPFGNFVDEEAISMGFRLNLAYHHGNWSDAESGLGDQGFVIGASIFLGIVELMEEK